ncbi:MAG: tyrosine-type recombinase/integrase, partial [Syntrophaceae bacterium]|nr:tyrosine-type recombinase/integrase [Syntrophaceae bacterium]
MNKPQALEKRGKNPIVVQKGWINKTSFPVRYLVEEEVKQLCEACKKERNKLLIVLLFQTGLRISEALALTPASIRNFEGKPAMEIVGKGKKLRMVALPVNLREKLESYAYRARIEPSGRFFEINRSRAWQILNEARETAGLEKRVFP